MRGSEKTAVVLVAASEEIANNLTIALADTNLELLYSHSEREAFVILERPALEVNLAIVELELPDFEGWDLIRRLTFRPEKRVKIIATTSTYPPHHFARIRDLGIDGVVPGAATPEAWRKTVEQVLDSSGRKSAETSPHVKSR